VKFALPQGVAKGSWDEGKRGVVCTLKRFLNRDGSLLLWGGDNSRERRGVKGQYSSQQRKEGEGVDRIKGQNTGRGNWRIAPESEKRK